MTELTFLMNADPPNASNRFYGLAEQFFTDAGSTVVAPSSRQTIEGIFTHLRTLNTQQTTINIVSHAVGFGAIEGPVTAALQAKGRSTTIADDMRDVIASKTLPPPGPGIVNAKTRLVLYGCDVGRQKTFLKLLCQLFGTPGEVLAPRRLSVFRLANSKVQYRQAQSWTLTRSARLIPAGSVQPAGGWAAYRTSFVNDAITKFGRIAIASELDSAERLKAMLTGAAKTATTAMGASFFLEENIDIFPDGTQTAKEAAESVQPLSNGDPITAIAQSTAQVDDTTMVTTISGVDAYPANPQKTKYSITVVMLAQVLEQEVPIAEGPGYARITSAPERAPSPGPAPAAGGGVGGGASNGGGTGVGDATAFLEDVRAVLDELLTDGAPQASVDAVLASLPKGDATEDILIDVEDGLAIPDDLENLALPPRATV